MHFWHAVFRQIVVLGFVKKEIETYGTLILTEKGEEFINNPKEIDLIKEHDFSDTDDKDIILNQKLVVVHWMKNFLKCLKILEKV